MRLCVFILIVSTPLVSFSQGLKPEVVGHIPRVSHESSGLAKADSDSFWTMNDGGNRPLLFQINGSGALMSTFAEPNLSNHDWEDLAEDSTRLYIGDFGNNLNKRHNLLIYFRSKAGVKQDSFGRITFHYPDQNQFPPPPSNWNFDCEAFFHHGDSLYLFSKNLSNPNDGYSKMYRLPDETGDYKAELIDSFYLNEPVTSADISPDGKTMVLLTYFSLWVFKGFPGNNFFEGKVFQFPFKGLTPKEAICFANDHELFITDERYVGKGGKLYKIDLNQLDFSQPTKKFKSQFCKRAIYNLVNNPRAKYRKIMSREAAQ